MCGKAKWTATEMMVTMAQICQVLQLVEAASGALPCCTFAYEVIQLYVQKAIYNAERSLVHVTKLL